MQQKSTSSPLRCSISISSVCYRLPGSRIVGPEWTTASLRSCSRTRSERRCNSQTSRTPSVLLMTEQDQRYTRARPLAGPVSQLGMEPHARARGALKTARITESVFSEIRRETAELGTRSLKSRFGKDPRRMPPPRRTAATRQRTRTNRFTSITMRPSCWPPAVTSKKTLVFGILGRTGATGPKEFRATGGSGLKSPKGRLLRMRFI